VQSFFAATKKRKSPNTKSKVKAAEGCPWFFRKIIATREKAPDDAGAFSLNLGSNQ
jgi:hypothetical protein